MAGMHIAFMVRRTPEYLGKKIQAGEVQMAMLFVLVFAGNILLMPGVAMLTPAGLEGRMVTSSGSGLDPHISPANGSLQVARVAQARHMDSSAIRASVERHVERRQFGFSVSPA
ncbi:MAG TPA: potassium-transporting ATPase subunit C [Gemmatimonadaceae bacterium]|nr:potassium-transporting ATPase subunit C [Gemmatimonadaceae bacterium]